MTNPIALIPADVSVNTADRWTTTNTLDVYAQCSHPSKYNGDRGGATVWNADEAYVTRQTYFFSRPLFEIRGNLAVSLPEPGAYLAKDIAVGGTTTGDTYIVTKYILTAIHDNEGSLGTLSLPPDSWPRGYTAMRHSAVGLMVDVDKDGWNSWPATDDYIEGSQETGQQIAYCGDYFIPCANFT
eukprot:tig00021532_g22187.t1